MISKNENEKGLVLVGVLALVAILALLATVSVTTTYTDIKITSNYKTSIQASYAAEAGYNHLIGEYLNNPDYFIAKDTATEMGLPDTEPGTANFGNSAYWFPSITYDSSDPPEYVDVDSYGKVWGTNSLEKIQVRITAVGSSPFNYGIFGNGDITLTGNGETNSYDSSIDPAASTLLSNGDVGTNATGDGVISLSGNADIYGDAQVGPGGNPDTDITVNGNAEVHGDKGVDDSPKDMTPMTDPGGGTPETLSISGVNTKTISSGTYRLPNISISGNSIGKISGDVILYLDGNTSISGNGKLEILDGASLTIYASGTVNISGNGIVNQNAAPRPEECVLVGTSSCTSVTVSGNGDLYAAIYAPTATTSVTGNGDVYGSLVGDTVTISGNGDVLFDESLQDLAVGEISSFNVTLWKYLNM
jgi:hypothetical protein